jgi:hypothetical protein
VHALFEKRLVSITCARLDRKDQSLARQGLQRTHQGRSGAVTRCCPLLNSFLPVYLGSRVSTPAPMSERGVLLLRKQLKGALGARQLPSLLTYRPPPSRALQKPY